MGRRIRELTPAERTASLLADIEALPRLNKRAASLTVSVDAVFRLAPYSIVREAAKLRRLHVASYVRRAAYALACADLGIPVTEALDRDPFVTRDTGATIEDAEGTRFGSWEVGGGA